MRHLWEIICNYQHLNQHLPSKPCITQLPSAQNKYLIWQQLARCQILNGFLLTRPFLGINLEAPLQTLFIVQVLKSPTHRIQILPFSNKRYFLKLGVFSTVSNGCQRVAEAVLQAPELMIKLLRLRVVALTLRLKYCAILVIERSNIIRCCR